MSDVSVEGLVIGLVLIIYGAWLLGTVIMGLPEGALKLQWLGSLIFFIPEWNFFAPYPNIHDYYLLSRDQYEGGTMSSWKVIRKTDMPRHWTAAFWNPAKTEKKALLDVSQALANEVLHSEIDEELVKVSIPYILLVNHVSKIDHPDMSVATQFLLMRASFGNQSIDPLFVSSVHKLA